MLTDKELSAIVQAWGNEPTQRNIVDLCRDVAKAQEAAERERWREAGWVCADGFPALLGHKPLKPGAKLYASPDDWA